MSADEIAISRGLTLDEVYAALAYYYDHRSTIDEAIKVDDALIAELRRLTPSKLRQKTRG